MSRFQLLGMICAALAIFLEPSFAGTKKTKRAADQEVHSKIAALVQQAKTLLAQGDRKQALILLENARAIANNKYDQRDLVSKQNIFSEQFITADSFQNFQEAKALADAERWDECLRELDSIAEKDRDNILVLRLRADSHLALRQYDLVVKNLNLILALRPGDLSSEFQLVEVAVAQKQVVLGLNLLEKIEPLSSLDIERVTILKAKLFEQSSRALEAVELLRQDQEAHLDHVVVLFELGMLYSRISGHDWSARKMLSLFVTRCKRMKESDLKLRHLDGMLSQAQLALIALDKKLGV